MLDERPGTHSLAYLARQFLGWPNYEPKEVEDYKATGQLDPNNMEAFYDYNAKDVSATLQLYDIMYPKVEEEGCDRLYQRQMIPFFNALTNIERRGFIYSKEKAADLNEEVILPKLRELTQRLRVLTGLEFYNPRSSVQTKGIVYERWGLKHKLRSTPKKKKDGFDKDVRKAVRDGNFTCNSRFRNKMIEFAEVMDLFQTINTQRGTFIEGLIKRTRPDGRLYCEFNPCGTVTGRISSRNPNFQNITRQARDVVPGIRTLFRASPGNVIVQADYSQAELRCIAVESDCKALKDIYYNSGISLHHETAKKYYGHSNYTKDEYTICKNMNFGICYLQGAGTFSQTYGLTYKEAQEYIDLWWTTFPETRVWVDHVKELVQRDTEVVNAFGRKRRFHLVTLDNLDDLHRQAVNMIPQSTASEFTISACIELDRLGVPLVSTVHDSNIADVPEDEAMDVAKLMKEVMERQPKELLDWDLPFVVDISIGPTWGDVEEIEL
jgi:DNA polymerase-1